MLSFVEDLSSFRLLNLYFVALYLQEDVLGFTKSDIQLQSGHIDSFVKCQQPEFLSELKSVQMLDYTVASQKTSADLVIDKSLANNCEPSRSSSGVSKKCDSKTSFVKHRYRSNLLQLQQERKLETTKSCGKRRSLLLLNMFQLLNLLFDVGPTYKTHCTVFRGLFDKLVTKQCYCVCFLNLRSLKYTFCREFF